MYVPALPAQPARQAPRVPSLTARTTIAELLSLSPVAPTSAARTALRVDSATLDVLSGHPAIVTGTLAGVADEQGAGLRPAALEGRTVTLQAAAGDPWRTVARSVTGAGGRFRLRFSTRRPGSTALRVRFAGDGSDLAGDRRVGELNVFRVAEASWYGGGGGLACGGTLTGATMGVASPTLPCGTRVTLRYDGHSVSVPVVDRGPFVPGREFDLTEATKRVLGFGGVGEVWSTR